MEMPIKDFPNNMEYTAFTCQNPIGLQLHTPSAAYLSIQCGKQWDCNTH